LQKMDPKRSAEGQEKKRVGKAPETRKEQKKTSGELLHGIDRGNEPGGVEKKGNSQAHTQQDWGRHLTTTDPRAKEKHSAKNRKLQEQIASGETSLRTSDPPTFFDIRKDTRREPSLLH